MGLTRDDLCERLGLSRRRVDDVLDYRGPATMGDLVKVADAVGCPLLEFLGVDLDTAPRVA